MNEASNSEPSEVSDDALLEEMTELSIEQPENMEVSVESTEEPAWVESGGDEDNAKIILEATLTIQKVTELHDNLLKAITDNDSLEIDASAVTTIDTASLQLLVILKQESIKLDKEVIFDFPSDKFIEAAELLGIEELLGVNQAAAGFF